MGRLSSDRLSEILDKSILKKYDCFIETGTFTGISIIPLAKKFKHVEFHTIEIVEELYLYAKSKAKLENIDNLNFHLGDSSTLIEKVINDTQKENVIIFLDAHSSSYEGYTAESIEKDISENLFSKIKNKVLGKKKKIFTDTKINKLSDIEVPLLNELTAISKIKKNFLIVIDDFDLFEKKFNFADWSNINEEKIKKLFENKITHQFKMSKSGHNSPQLILEIKNK
tara:strand:- start:15300 stop:15977 length:678 start_codon:yes stop_codon:yes gene_type:complete